MRVYVERISYGRYVSIARGRTMDGSYYTFKKGYIGGPHNYRVISLPVFVFLKLKYWIIETFFKSHYKKMVDRSWGRSPKLDRHAYKR